MSWPRIFVFPKGKPATFLFLALALSPTGCGEHEPAMRAVLPPCPERMAQVGEFCIDRYESRIEEGVAVPARDAMPAVGVTFNDADRACRTAGFRLCNGEEWTRACRGPDAHPVPYGPRWVAHTCNSVQPDDDMNLFPVRNGGSFPGCVSQEGVFDLVGNVWEWTSEPNPAGNLREVRGGGSHNAEPQSSCTINDRVFMDLDADEGLVGFRCCSPIRT